MTPAISYFLKHLKELRNRLFLSLFVWFLSAGFVYFFGISFLWDFLIRPLQDIYGGHTPTFVFFTLPSAFLMHLKLAGWGGFILTLPFIFWQIWCFLSPALYQKERRLLARFFLIAPLLFMIGVCFCYFFILSNAWNFFVNHEFTHNGKAMLAYIPQIEPYVSLTLDLLLAFGLSFELPLLLLSLGFLGILDAQSLAEKRRYVIVGLFIFAAVVTPPDVLSQLALAFPLWGLYEITILLMKRIEKKKNA